MTTRKPLVVISGLTSELPPGDLVPGIDTTAQASGNAALVVASNALASGNLGISNAATALASGNSALIVGANALASGNLALTNAATALSSGNAALVVGSTALASGNAALGSLANKYDKTGGPISGPVTVQSQSIGTSTRVVASGVIILNFGAGNNFEVTLTSGTQTLASPANASGGQTGTIIVRQDNTGSRLLTYSGAWSFQSNTAPTLTTTASGVDLLAYYVVNPSRINTVATLNYGSGTVA
jgi:trimeric autotransporter adhesin